MRAKFIMQYLPLPSKFRLAWDRFTSSRLTMAYVIFSLVHFIIQVAFQSKAFTINAEAADFLYSILAQGNATTNGFTVFDHELRICEDAPAGFSANECRVVWDGTPKDNQVNPSAASSRLVPSSSIPSSSSITPSSTLPITSASARTTFTSSVLSTASAPRQTITTTFSLVTSQTSTSISTTSAATPTITSPGVNNAQEFDSDSSDDEFSDDSSVSSDDELDLKERWVLLEERDDESWKIMAFEEDGVVKVKLDGMDYSQTDAILDRSCLWAMNHPVGILHNTKREDIVFIAFQFWVLGMSAVALLNESIPHIIASLLTHVLATAWAVFQLQHTASFRSQFNRLITNGACKGTKLLPHYWEQRGKAEIPILALNVAALFVSGFLTWRLIKLFGWQTFKRIGASRHINRLYKIVLSLSITVQLSFFFMAVTAGLWIDQLANGAIGHLAILKNVYQPIFIVTFILLVPWIVCGWIAIRRELKVPMLVFLVICIWYLAGVSSMFTSTTFRWTFVQWLFFRLMVIISMVLTIICFVLGLISRWNFERGLTRYLNATEALPGDDFIPVYGTSDLEKVDFPSNEKLVPTFSATFGSGNEVPPPHQMNFGNGPRRMGPRFYSSSSSEPFESDRSISTMSIAPALPHLPQAHTKWRSGSDESHGSVTPLQRYNSMSSGSRGFDSYYGGSEATHYRSNSQSSVHSSSARSTNSRRPRWVIE